ncbi:RNA recognition motif domain containing protein [Acanthamoeba castellanii str. Neff]|uniref:RNA recognition motif domain containing protein n=1 Tax=Acanthamoeba castellanii (strain ATCC 30010 / Neff) TaxID=1257118 RepID=L8GGZ7_ACACF|nr:RNA recognition motif domain containing protein [Acanthamoeba castellanii str. Neff]ELR12257.1 RNA recognition motif domain containing protein [Acanthamoeba castellanii str. Neff]
MDHRRGGTAAPDEPYDAIRAGSIDGTDPEPHDHAILHDPSQDPQIRGSARRTVFVGRLDFVTNEETLRTTFERFGPIRHLRLVRDIVTGKSKGYAFVEYEHESDAHAAYRDMHGKDIDQARVLVEMERERTMAGWVPRRLGGGLGGKKESGQIRFGGRDRPWRQPLRFNQLAQQRGGMSGERGGRQAEREASEDLAHRQRDRGQEAEGGDRRQREEQRGLERRDSGRGEGDHAGRRGRREDPEHERKRERRGRDDREDERRQRDHASRDRDRRSTDSARDHKRSRRDT